MKIDFIISALNGGGAERVLVLLANHFSSIGYEVSIITFNNGDAYELNNSIKRVKLHHGSFPNHTIRSLFNLLKYYSEKENKPDIAISFINRISFVSIIACKLRSIKIIVSEHINHLRIKNRLVKFNIDYLYKYAKHVTVLTEFDVEFYKNKKANVVVMPNPCTFKIVDKINLNREKVILAIGNLDRYPHKGFDNLITIVKPILEKYPEWSLKIVGGGDNGMTFLKKLAKEHNLSNRVIFTGFRNDVNQIMRNSEIFILSSRFEGLPMVLLEAMSQGMSCISYNCKTGPSDIIKNNINGLLIKDQDINMMREGLVSLIENESLRENISGKAIKSLDKYSMENIGLKWEELFKN